MTVVIDGLISFKRYLSVHVLYRIFTIAFKDRCGCLVFSRAALTFRDTSLIPHQIIIRIMKSLLPDGTIL